MPRLVAGLLLPFILAFPLTATQPVAAGQPTPLAVVGGEFSFGAAGDFGYSTNALATFATAGAAGLDFFVALGDTTYAEANESTWCGAFRAEVPNLLIQAGNHDTGESTGANLNTLLAQCPYPLSENLTGRYGREWFFDYPGGAPLARFVLTGCGLSFPVDGEGKWTCAANDTHYNFVRDAVDGARAAGIQWVVVGVHKNCLSVGDKTCEIGTDFFDLLLAKRVDLILQGHDHLYARSKQLGCATPNLYLAPCVVDDGSDGRFRNATGSVLAVVGTGGKSFYPYDPQDAEAPYFGAAWDTTHGFLQVAINQTAIAAQFVRSAGANDADAFVIEARPRLDLVAPIDGAVLSLPAVNVTGVSQPGAIVSVNGARADVAHHGSFSIAVPLWPGNNSITVTARDQWGTAESLSVRVTYIDPTVKLRVDLEAALARLDEVRQELNVTQSQLDQARVDLQAALVEVDGARRAAENATNASAAASAQVTNLSGALTDANRRLGEAQAKVAQLEASGNATAAELAAAKSNLSAAQVAVDSLETQLVDARDELAITQAQVELVGARLAGASANATAALRAAEAAEESARRQEAAIARSQAEAEAARASAQGATWLAIGGITLGVLGVGIAIASMRRQRRDT